ncbi:DUF6166 domain-containing protein [Hymenobacter glacieicola]|uniref:Uncharacterized protein n=1 Tax=Hymenobacter glacieicola TaxID=1562124 RepID=A0ABQ1X4A7_9BACT|nr:DUF6166 domain-containing protein [Hymenobacter glacieicola]GGG59296.1 hypothetical protein GCM10011378_39110 [Hymenobacter glacieicola]
MIIELACQLPNPQNPEDKKYLLDGTELSLEKSREVIDLSNAFNHSYPGVSSRQLALAVCLELFGREAAVRLFSDFNDDYIVKMGHDGNGNPQHEEFTVLLDVSKYAALADEQ